MQRAASFALGAALLIAATARADDAQAWLEKGLVALEKKDGHAAAEALEQARSLAPKRADVVYQLARACELDGRASDAIAFFGEAVRLDPAGVGAAARADEERLRSRWVRIELDSADEHLRARRLDAAIEGFERAYDLCGPKAETERARARDGHARATAEAVVAAALKDRPKGTSVGLAPFAGAQGPDLAELARALRGELERSFGAAGATLLETSKRGDAVLVVDVTAGQRVVVRVADRASGGAVATRTVRALVKGRGTSDLAPEKISLDLSIEAERDSGGRTVRVPVSEGTVLASGDRFRIRARPSREAHLYAFIFDSKGRATLLYPGTERLFPALEKAGVRTPNPIAAGRELVIPPPPPAGRAYWFFLDRETGTETFYVAASLEPLEDVEALVKELDAAGEAGRQATQRLAESLDGRGSATRVEEGEGAAGHLEIIRGRGAVVRHLQVEHR